jgi:predicted pyridoxine 5'-phosphate oxidase superfamily flavin-nucleotide-binding protein
MTSPFHTGELEMQRRAGAVDQARDVGRIIGRRVPAAAARFLERQRLAVAASLDTGGGAWASLLTGPPGFVSAVDERLLRLGGRPADGDPLVENLRARPELGLLVIDLATRQRMRFNGRGLEAPEGIFLMVDQVYGNCPRYIQRRSLERGAPAAPAGPPVVSGALDEGQREWIRRSDTFFIASAHPDGGADASHRGGMPGFVRVSGPARLAFDDYPGNGMFNTLGNLLACPAVGLLFVDFESGDVLQLSGRAEVAADFSVEVAIEAVRETPSGSPLRWRFEEYSPAHVDVEMKRRPA